MRLLFGLIKIVIGISVGIMKGAFHIVGGGL